MQQLSIEDAIEAGRQAAEACLDAATRFGDFNSAEAERVMLAHLEHGPATGEDLTDACKAVGLAPSSDKAFGSVIQGLSKAGRIEFHNMARRRKGHGSPCICWRISRGAA